MRQEFQKPLWMKDWKIFLLFSVISFAIAFGLRCLDLPEWDNPNFMVNGEYIMGTHDAYYWLAGAKGIGSAVGNPMSGMIRFLGSVTGAQYGNIAFWLPAVFAGFCAIAAFAWGMLVAGPWVGLVGAVYATSIPAYYYRTRLSYYDTDVVTLFFPLLISVLLARWVSLGIRDSWLLSENSEIGFSPTFWDYCLPVVAGAFTFYGQLWHGDVLSFGIVVFFIAVGLSLVCGTTNTRPELMRGIVLFCVVAFAGWVGFAVAALLLIVFTLPAVKNHKLYNNIYLSIVIISAVIILSGMGQTLVAVISGKLAAYLKPVVAATTTSVGPVYPGIAQSVIEAQNLSFDVLFVNLTGNALLGWLGLISFAFVLFVRPLSVFLLPFAAVTFAAVYMGGRFAMFGGIAIGLGLSFSVYWVIERLRISLKNKAILGAVQSLFIVFLLFSNVFAMYNSAQPTPIIGPSHIKALLESRAQMPKDSVIWTWWDWGYATMYYAQMDSFANGGNHAGPVLFPLGLAYASPSYLQSNQLIKFSADNGNNPSKFWDKMPATEVNSMLRSFGAAKYNIPHGPKQYIVVNWESIRLAYWILFYGSWNVMDGGGIHPNVASIHNQFDFEEKRGIVTIKGETPVSVSSSDFFYGDSRDSRIYPDSVGPHLLYCQKVKQGFMVDDFMYHSLLVRLLIGDPNNLELSRYFKLIYDDGPLVRIYEVI